MEQRVLLEVCLLLVLNVTVCLAKKKIDLAFLVDGWSVSPFIRKIGHGTRAKDESVKDLIRIIYGNFPPDDDRVHVGLVRSGATAKIAFDFNAYKDLESLDKAVAGLIFPRSAISNLGKALDLANYGLFRNSGRTDAVKVLVVVAQTKSSDDVNRAARDLRNSGVNILSAWFGKEKWSRDDLQNIVSPPKQYNLFRDRNALQKLAPIIVKRIHYVVATSRVPIHAPKVNSNPKPQKEGNRCSRRCDVKVKGGERIKINCKNCKLVGCCDRCCKRDGYDQPFYPGPVELAVILDESGELKSWNNFVMMKRFIKNLTREFELSNKKTKIGIVSFTGDNLQIFDLHSYHDNKNIDSQIDKLNYEGIRANSGDLNKALDATQANLFTGERDLGVPRLMIFFDSAAKKDDQTEVKAFKLQGTDVQRFCIGLGTSYDKTDCNKIVEKPYRSHSLSAQVAHLSQLQEPIMLMIVSDIARKYCPLCVQATNAACRPCNIARRYIGSEESKSLQHSEKVLKLVNDDIGENNHLKLGLKLTNSNEDDSKLGDKNKAVKLLGGTQVGTPLPNVELVKDLLQSGSALNSDSNSRVPLIADSQVGLLQQSPSLVQQSMLEHPLQPQQFVQQQQQLQQQQEALNNFFPSITAARTPFSDNQKILAPLLKSAPLSSQLLPAGNVNQGESTDSSLTLQPVVFNPSLLSQALLGTGKFQRGQEAKLESLQGVSLGNGMESNTLPLGALSTLPVRGSDSTSTSKTDPSQADEGMTTSLSAASAPLDVSKKPQFQSPLLLPYFQAPLQLASSVQKTNRMGFQPSLAKKNSPFDDEYKYDLNDKEGPFVMACRDLSDECASYATEGGCDDFAPLSSIGDVKTMCKKSCGLCDGNPEMDHRKPQTKQTLTGYNRSKKYKLHR